MKKLALLILFAASFAGAQTTTITGTIRDLTNALVTSGKVTFTLTPSRDTTISGLARFAPNTVTCLINGSGLIKAQDGVSTCTVTSNTALQPTGTYYVVAVWPGFVKTSTFTFYAVLASYDWSTVVPTPTTSPAQNFVDIFSNQTIGGDKIWTGNHTFQGNVTISGTVTAPNLVDTTSNQTVGGNKTFTGTVNLGVNGNVALKPASSAGMQYVTSTGSDANDGFSMGTAKATLAAAIAALPNITVGGKTLPSGTVQIASGTGYTMTSTITTKLNFVQIWGIGREATIVTCTVTPCFSWDNSASLGGDPATGGLYNFTLAGNGSSNQFGISMTDGNGLHLVGMKIVGFNGTGSIGVKAVNLNFQTERLVFFDTWFDNNTQSIFMQGTGAHPSFSHESWFDLNFNLRAAGQTAIALGTNVSFGDTIIGVVNNDNGAGTTNVFTIADATSAIDANTFVNMIVDNNGGGTVVGVVFTSGSPLFRPYGSFQGYSTAFTGSGTFLATLPNMKGAQYSMYQGGFGGGGLPFFYGAFQSKRNVTGCTTAASAGNTCTTTVTWPTAYADANYTAICTGAGVNSGTPVIGGYQNRLAASVDVLTMAVTAAASKFTNIECYAIHDP